MGQSYSVNSFNDVQGHSMSLITIRLALKLYVVHHVRILWRSLVW